MRNLYAILIILFAINLQAQQTTLYFEDFNSYSNGTGTGSGSPAMWTTAGESSPEWGVRNQQFRGYDDCTNARWITKDIDVTGYSNVFVSMDVSSTVDNQDHDYFRVYYSIDGGSYVLAFEQYQAFHSDDINFQVPVDGSNTSLKIKIRVDIDNWNTGNQKYFFDNVLVEDCQGINAGTTSVNEDSVINNTPVELTLSGEDAGTTLQWQISEDGGATYSNLQDATTNPYTTHGLLGEKWYYFRAAVDNGSCFSYSSIDSVYVGPGFCATTYDQLVYDTLNSNQTYDDGVVQIHPVSQINGNVHIDNDGFNNFGEINGDINFSSNGGYFCNEGYINAGNLSDNSNGGDFSNYGFITIDGDFIIDNNGGSWHSWCDFTVEGDLKVQGNSEPHFTGTVHILGDFNLTNNGDVYLEDSSIIIIDGNLINSSNGLHLGVNSYISCNNLTNNDDIIGDGSNSSEYSQIIVNGTTTSGGNDYLGYLDVCGFSSGDNPNLGANVTECVNMVTPHPTTSYCTGAYTPPLSAYITDQTNILCHGECTGEAIATPYGGVDPITYLWDNGNTDSTATSLCAGAHTVTVTDAVDSTVVLNVDITEPDTLESSYVVVDLTCYQSNDGSITFTVTGGTTPYEFQINPPGTGYQSSNLFSGLVAGSYAVTVQDANHCRNQYIKIDVEEPGEIVLDTVITNIDCNGNTNGAFLVQTTGGTPAYQYSIDGTSYQTDSNFTGLSAGTYDVTVQDSHACTATLSNIQIIEPTAITLTYDKTNLQCYNDGTGTITVNASGGSPAYQYSIDGSNYQASNQFTGLSAGFYNITVVDDSSCTATINNIEIAEPSELTAVALETNILCNSDNTGAISVTPTGGTSPYQYSIDAGANYQSSNQFNNLVAGTYNIIVQDDSTCTYTINNIVITEPTALNISTDSIVNVLCNGDNSGAVAFTTTGGTPNSSTPDYYEYSFNDISYTTDSAYTGMTAGNYWIYVQDANACKDSLNFDITEPASALSLTTSSTSSTCGNANGSATVNASGGTPGYTYEWADDASETSNTLSNIIAGGYLVSVTDNNGCLESVTVNVSDFGAGTLSFSNEQHNICYGDSLGTVEVSITGGASPYTYTWDNGQTGTVASNLPAGTYTVEVEDANNCVVSDSYTILDSSQIQINLTQYDLSCYNDNSGIITAQVSGGTPTSGTDYQYNWSNGTTGTNIDSIYGLSAGEYVLEITDYHSCTMTDTVTITQPDSLVLDTIFGTNLTCYNNNTGYAIIDTVTGGTSPYNYEWSNSETTLGIINLSAGTYSVTVTDNHNCYLVDSVEITQPDSFNVSANISPTYCAQNLGNIDLTVSGGTPTYTYQWNNPSDTIYNSLDSNYIDTLAEGSYFVTITDLNSCQYTNYYEISNIPAGTITILDSLNLTCYNDNSGKIIAQITGGNPTYNFEWIKDASIIQQGSVASNIDSILNISAGVYTISVSDTNNCVSTKNITITQPDSLQGTYNYIDNACAGETNAYIYASISGGTPNYTYNWSNGLTTDSITGLVSGEYILTLTDINSCQIIDTINIKEPNELILTNTINNVLCFGEENGEIHLNISGGTPEYTIEWDNSQSQAVNLIGLGAGIYQVTITDSLGCSQSNTITISQPEPYNVSSSVNSITCYAYADGAINLNVDGATSPYTYSWNTGDTTNTLSGLDVGQYIVNITDSNNCVYADTINISQPDSIYVTDSVYYENNLGQITVTTYGGTPSYTYDWNNGETSQNNLDLEGGTYTVTITDANSCEYILAFIVDDVNPIVIPTVITPNADGFNDTWNILNIENIEKMEIHIFNRWGDELYNYSGSGLEYTDKSIQWNGMWNGKELPLSSYVYILVVDDEDEYTGTVTIVR